MKLLNLELSNFRNYSHIKFIPEKNINVIIGKNAIGKTNLIESIYVLTCGKSFRTSRESELINLNSDRSIITGEIESFGYEDSLKIELNTQGKSRYFINDEEMNLRNYKRDMASVIFSPADLNMVKLSPQERRKYIDNLISKIDPIYEHNLNKYRKILNERNKLLKNIKDKSLIEIYDFQLSDYGVKILRTRLNIIKSLEEYAKEHFSRLTSGQNFKITYLSTVQLSKDEDEMKKMFLSQLQCRISRDMELKYTTTGPHRDDLDFKIDGLSVKSFGSQGEVRSTVLSLTLAEVDLIRKVLKSQPVLILDDVFSELDKSRAEYFIESIKDVQTFITSTDLNEENFKNLNCSIFEIREGKLINKIDWR